jgi:hypothetical protein
MMTGIVTLVACAADAERPSTLPCVSVLIKNKGENKIAIDFFLSDT